MNAIQERTKMYPGWANDITNMLEEKLNKAVENLQTDNSLIYFELRSICVKCLNKVTLSKFLKNDHYCDSCNESEETYPNSSPNHFEVYRPIDHYGLN